MRSDSKPKQRLPAELGSPTILPLQPGDALRGCAQYFPISIEFSRHVMCRPVCLGPVHHNELRIHLSLTYKDTRSEEKHGTDVEDAGGLNGSGHANQVCAA